MLRQVRLKGARVNEYPELIPGVWYTAAAVDGRVKAARIVQEGPAVEIEGRVLPHPHSRSFEKSWGSREV